MINQASDLINHLKVCIKVHSHGITAVPQIQMKQTGITISIKCLDMCGTCVIQRSLCRVGSSEMWEQPEFNMAAVHIRPLKSVSGL